MPRGGARPGAGRPRKTKQDEPASAHEVSKPNAGADESVPLARDPLQFLLDVMQGTVKPTTDQLRAGIAAAQYVHSKAQEGKRSTARKEAESAAEGKFKPKAPPKLIVNNR